MSVESLRRNRRALTAGVVLSALALVMARTSGDASAGLPAAVAGLAFVACLVLLVVYWRREHAESEAQFRAREAQTLAMLQMQVELARQKAAHDQAKAESARETPATGTPAAGSESPDAADPVATGRERGGSGEEAQ